MAITRLGGHSPTPFLGRARVEARRNSSPALQRLAVRPHNQLRASDSDRPPYTTKLSKTFLGWTYQRLTNIYEWAGREPMMARLAAGSWAVGLGVFALHEHLPGQIGRDWFSYVRDNLFGMGGVIAGLYLLAGIPVLIGLLNPRKPTKSLEGFAVTVDMDAPDPITPSRERVELESGLPHGGVFRWAKDHKSAAVLTFFVALLVSMPLLGWGAGPWIISEIGAIRGGTFLFVLGASFLIPLIRGALTPADKPSANFPTLAADLHEMSLHRRRGGIALGIAAGATALGLLTNWSMGLSGGLALVGAYATATLLVGMIRRNPLPPLSPFGAVMALARRLPSSFGSPSLYLWGWIVTLPFFQYHPFGKAVAGFIQSHPFGAAVFTTIFLVGSPLIRALFWRLPLVQAFFHVKRPEINPVPKQGNSWWDWAYLYGKYYGSQAMVVATLVNSLVLLRVMNIGLGRAMATFFGEVVPLGLGDAFLGLLVTLTTAIGFGFAGRSKSDFKPSGMVYYLKDRGPGDDQPGGMPIS